MRFMILCRAISCLRRRAARAQVDTLVPRGPLKPCVFSQTSKLFGAKSIPPAESSCLKLQLTNYQLQILLTIYSYPPGLNSYKMHFNSYKMCFNSYKMPVNSYKIHLHSYKETIARKISSMFSTPIPMRQPD